MNYVKVTKDHVTATDAMILIRVKTHLIFSEEFIKQIPACGFLIHREDWRKMSTGKEFVWSGYGHVIRILYKRKRHSLIEPVFEDGYLKHPQVDDILKPGKAEKISKLGINGEFLATLQKIVPGTLSLRLYFMKNTNAIKVEFKHQPEIEAVVMPVMINDKTKSWE